jgi:gamma-glutamyl-gamma-aminobutyrate hydrolase PuuD
MKLGYSPFNSPSFNPIEPFHHLFHEAVNLYSQAKVPDDLDAVLLWGGADISPSTYDEKPIAYSGPTLPSTRDLFEWEILRQAMDLKIPVIGVCRGAQLACAFAGGKLIQDVSNHSVNHYITTFDDEEFFVSSSHHQMMYPYLTDHELLAWSTRHLSRHYEPKTWYSAELENRQVKEPEVVYFPVTNTLAVQCHPEWHTDKQGRDFNDWFINLIKTKLLNKESSSCAC